MNDAMKLALGVTGFASLLALAIPANFDVADNQEEQASPNPVPAPSQPAKVPATADAAPQVIVEDDEDEDFSFGDPTASTDPIDFEEFDNDNNERDSGTAQREKSTIINKVRNPSITGPSNAPSFGSPAGPVQAAEGQALSSPISQGQAKPLPAQAPKQTIGTGGNPINSSGLNISSAPSVD